MTDRRKLVTELYESIGTLKRCVGLKHLPGMETIDLNRPQLELLFYLNCTPDKKASIKELISVTQTTSSAVTQLVETLEKHGYVERKPSSKDRRVVIVQFTGQGEEKLSALHRRLIETLLELTGTLTDAELENLAAMHKKIAARSLHL